MMRDEDVFPDPDAFKPERHLRKTPAESKQDDQAGATERIAEASGDDPSSIVFGFGRRSEIAPAYTVA